MSVLRTPPSRFFDFRFQRQGRTIDRYGEIDFQGSSTLHFHPARRENDWIVREDPAQGKGSTPLLEISEDAREVRPIKGSTLVLWTKVHGSKKDTTSHVDGRWISTDEIDYTLLQVIDSGLQVLVDLNPVVRDLHETDRRRYANTRNLSFRQTTSSCPTCSSRFQVDP